MQVECAWCGRIVGEKDGLGRSGTTSGICEACFAIICSNLPPEEVVPEPAADRPRRDPLPASGLRGGRPRW
jgi:hypothetical protein